MNTKYYLIRTTLMLSALLLSTCENSALAVTTTSFSADLQRANVSPTPTGNTPANVSGTASFTLYEPEVGESGEPELAYSIELLNVDSYVYRAGASPETVSSFDDLVDIHVHYAPAGSNNQGTPHVLNILGKPLLALGDEHEDDLVFESYDSNTMTTIISGRWDAADVVQTAGLPMEGPKTKPLANFLSELMAGDLFMMIHTVGDGTGAIGGHIQAIPEPGTWALLLLGQGLVLMRRR